MIELFLALTLHYVDYKQTLEIVKNPMIQESNLILGKSPSKKNVDLYFAATGVLIYAAHKSKLRKPLLFGIIATSTLYITNNYNVGIEIKF